MTEVGFLPNDVLDVSGRDNIAPALEEPSPLQVRIQAVCCIVSVGQGGIGRIQNEGGCSCEAPFPRVHCAHDQRIEYDAFCQQKQETDKEEFVLELDMQAKGREQSKSQRNADRAVSPHSMSQFKKVLARASSQRMLNVWCYQGPRGEKGRRWPDLGRN